MGRLYIYPHLIDGLWSHVGKYTSPMDPIGSIETNDQLMLYMDGYFCARGLGFESGYPRDQ